MSKVVLQIQDLKKTYQSGERQLDVLRGVSFEVKGGEIVALLGQSGAGKSTLLHCAGLLDRADEGLIMLDDEAANTLSIPAQTRLRRSAIGFVYQFHYLLPDFDALENVMMPLIIAGQSREAAKQRATSLLERMGLAERMTHRPGRLSGGEQQRVAIARALANKPKLLLADEPTGNLDEATASRVFALMLDLVREEGASALIATHNPALADNMDRKLEMVRGHLSEI